MVNSSLYNLQLGEFWRCEDLVERRAEWQSRSLFLSHIQFD